MNRCEGYYDLLAEYVAAGEPDTLVYVGLRRHLRECPRCSAMLPALRSVEEVLRQYPEARPDPALLRQILQAVSLEQLPEAEHWKLLPWDVWVPAAAVGGALLIALLAVPSEMQVLLNLDAPPMLFGNLEGRIAALRVLTSQDRFWTIWSAAALFLCGAGMRLFVTRCDDATRRQVGRFEEQVSDAASRIAELARRAR